MFGPRLRLARKKEGLSMRDRTTLRDEGSARTPFALRDASVGGSGLQAEFRGGDWSTIRKAAYGERGG